MTIQGVAPQWLSFTQGLGAQTARSAAPAAAGSMVVTTKTPTVSAKTLANQAAGAEPPPTVDPELINAAREFEAVFVRQMLSSIRFGGGDADQGHGALIVDSLAKTVTSGEGLGLARSIERMLAASYRSDV